MLSLLRIPNPISSNSPAMKMCLPKRIQTTIPPLQQQRCRLSTSLRLQNSRPTSSSDPSSSKTSEKSQKESTREVRQKKTMAELDEELRQKLEGMSGDGGASGVELEDGKPVAMKRGVRENMFRLI